MKPEIKNLWVEALRSGNYEQGTEYLHQNYKNDFAQDQYCCLGVLCEIALETGIGLELDVTKYNSRILYNGEDQYLPDKVIEWAGLEDVADGSGDIRVQNTTLASLNDGAYTFGEIADIIEKEL